MRKKNRASRRALALLLLCGCAPNLQAVRAVSESDGVRVAFCGSARQTEGGASIATWGPGGLGWGSAAGSDLNRSDLCLTFTNNSDGALVIDRRKIKLVGDGFRGRLVDDGQSMRWTVKPGSAEDISATFDTYDLDRNDEVLVSLKGAATVDGGPIKLAPLRLTYR